MRLIPDYLGRGRHGEVYIREMTSPAMHKSSTTRQTTFDKRMIFDYTRSYQLTQAAALDKQWIVVYTRFYQLTQAAGGEFGLTGEFAISQDGPPEEMRPHVPPLTNTDESLR